MRMMIGALSLWWKFSPRNFFSCHSMSHMTELFCFASWYRHTVNYIYVMLIAFCYGCIWLDVLVMLGKILFSCLCLAVLKLNQREKVAQEVSTNFVVFRLNSRLLLASQHCQGLRFVLIFLKFVVHFTCFNVVFSKISNVWNDWFRLWSNCGLT